MTWLKMSFICLIALLFSVNCLTINADPIVNNNSSTVEISGCRGQIVETIPVGLVFPSYKGPVFNSTIASWLDLVSSAQSSIDIASYYWTLLCSDVENPIKESCEVGESFVEALKEAVSRGVKVRVAVNGNDKKVASDPDLRLLKDSGITVANLDFDRLIGAGILHTKFIVVDNSSFYLGSANMDWRSLTQVKELGIYIQNCPSLGDDLAKVFNVYWSLGQPNATIPDKWPSTFETDINMENPLNLTLEGISAKVFMASAPPKFNPSGRTSDIDAILAAINDAKRYVYIAVMDYSPTFLYGSKPEYWPVIDNALRKAVVERSIDVKLLAANWTHTKYSSVIFLKSLNELYKYPGKGALSVKLFNVPGTVEQQKVPYSRVNHNKYMVTDQMVYIGTSNWSADYFVNTGGVSFVASFADVRKVRNLRKDILDIFYRDWESTYSFNVNKYSGKRRPT
ncbi:phospholipase D3 [Tetranychus urticae]|uniref:phospholipase D3 n=1 Tax=Tetranychus urticae TaxID=32264 RepID=UPI00077BAF8C|nr:phospholipase D3 [Tetranychus urticae]